MSTQITPPQGNGGSRESSEFEFVNVLNRPNLPGPPPVQHSNPLLLSSNQAAPGPGILLSSSQPPRGPPAPAILTTPVKPPAVSIEEPTPTPPVLSAQPPALSVSVPDQTRVATVTAESPPTPGMFGWVKGSGFLSKVVEKTKSVTENVITTLDPQMKEFIHSGGDVEIVVTSDKEDKVIPVREAFQEVFGQATVYGLASKCVSIAEQPVGFASGKQAALERISTLRKSGMVGPEAVLVSVENFLYEVNDEIWIDLSCLVLSDPQRKINLQTFSQPTNVEAGYVEKLRAGTGDNYPKQWSGFALTTGSVMGEILNVPPPSWQEAVTGLHRRKLLLLASQALAGMYKRALQANVEDI